MIYFKSSTFKVFKNLDFVYTILNEVMYNIRHLVYKQPDDICF